MPRTATGAVSRPAVTAGLLACAVLLLAACSSSGGSAGPPARTVFVTPSESPSPVPVPTPTTPPYGPILAKAIAPLDAALARLPETGDLTAFGAALEDVRARATSGSLELERAQEPAAVSTTHRQLLVALDALAEHVTKVQGEISHRSICASSAALARFGQAEALTTLPAALQALATAGYPATLTVPKTGELQQRSLDNGTLVREGSRDGEGELTIDNGGGGDAVVSLSKGGKSVHSVYIAKGKTAKVKGIEDGTYDIYFAGGTDWDSTTKAFTQNCDFSKFDDTMTFETTSTYTTWEITLQAAVGGNATTSDVPEGSYPLP